MKRTAGRACVLAAALSLAGCLSTPLHDEAREPAVKIVPFTGYPQPDAPAARAADPEAAPFAAAPAVARNWRVMIGWGALIVLFTAAGLVTFYVGLAVTMPLIGYASWHAYRDLVGGSVQS